jgi:hypothetical protein
MRHLPASIVVALIATLFAGAAVAQTAVAPPELAPGAQSNIGYSTVAEALEALKAKPGVTLSVTQPDAWVIISEPDRRTVWSFTPESHYAYPAVVKRTIKVDANGNVFVETGALCQAQKAPCDRLIQEFMELNERMRESVQKRLKEGAK